MVKMWIGDCSAVGKPIALGRGELVLILSLTVQPQIIQFL